MRNEKKYSNNSLSTLSADLSASVSKSISDTYVTVARMPTVRKLNKMVYIHGDFEIKKSFSNGSVLFRIPDGYINPSEEWIPLAAFNTDNAEHVPLYYSAGYIRAKDNFAYKLGVTVFSGIWILQ